MADGAEAAAIVLSMGTAAGSVLYLVRTTLDHIRSARTEKLQTDLYTRMLDKFGSSQDLLAYLETDAGKNLLKPPPQASEAVAPAPTRRIMNSVQIGTVLLAIGTAFLLMKASIQDFNAREPLTVFGILGVMAGVGFLVSALASWQLSKMWGLLPERKDR